MKLDSDQNRHTIGLRSTIFKRTESKNCDDMICPIIWQQQCPKGFDKDEWLIFMTFYYQIIGHYIQPSIPKFPPLSITSKYCNYMAVDIIKFNPCPATLVYTRF